ncbi:hypothetical protein [Puerhibacterium puerhi]|uniref:hypothetical protein n=1 Tax=Puerhibacterium puerhi TaxID=2692623 RepID=UPI00135BAB1F|nr:hypothetical protein [Puerhibacterium puerhi]
MEPLASLEELQNRLDWVLDEQEKVLAESALEDASALVRAQGLNWTPQNIPPVAKTIVLAAARRYVVNNQGLVTSRAGDETLQWADIGDKAGSVYLTEDEKKTLSTITRGVGFGSIPMTAWKTRPGAADDRPYYVPVSGWPGERPFPYYASDTEPW